MLNCRDPNDPIEEHHGQIASVLPKYEDDPDARELYEALASAQPPRYSFDSNFGLQSES